MPSTSTSVRAVAQPGLTSPSEVMKALSASPSSKSLYDSTFQVLVTTARAGRCTNQAETGRATSVAQMATRALERFTMRSFLAVPWYQLHFWRSATFTRMDLLPLITRLVG